MKVLMKISLPHETFSAAVRGGSAGKKTEAILNEVMPDAIGARWFTKKDFSPL